MSHFVINLQSGSTNSKLFLRSSEMRVISVFLVISLGLITGSHAFISEENFAPDAGDVSLEMYDTASTSDTESSCNKDDIAALMTVLKKELVGELKAECPSKVMLMAYQKEMVALTTRYNMETAALKVCKSKQCGESIDMSKKKSEKDMCPDLYKTVDQLLKQVLHLTKQLKQMDQEEKEIGVKIMNKLESISKASAATSTTVISTTKKSSSSLTPSIWEKTTDSCDLGQPTIKKVGRKTLDQCKELCVLEGCACTKITFYRTTCLLHHQNDSKDVGPMKKSSIIGCRGALQQWKRSMDNCGVTDPSSASQSSSTRMTQRTTVKPVFPEHVRGRSCTKDEYYTGYGCMIKHETESQWCPLFKINPPTSRQARCVNGGNNFWYIHVGGKQTEWVRGSDAMCLGISNKPRGWGVEECQYKSNQQGCEEILRWAGCSSSKSATSTAATTTTTTTTRRNRNMRPVHRETASSRDCTDDEYFTSYGCMTRHEGQSQYCPISASNPPASGRASCKNGGNNFWYIHVGGRRHDWKQGTDAFCLSTSNRPTAWGRKPCQFRWKQSQCEALLTVAGCA